MSHIAHLLHIVDMYDYRAHEPQCRIHSRDVESVASREFALASDLSKARSSTYTIIFSYESKVM